MMILAACLLSLFTGFLVGLVAQVWAERGVRQMLPQSHPADTWLDGWGAGWRAATESGQDDPGDEGSPILPQGRFRSIEEITAEGLLKSVGLTREIPT